MWRFILFSVVAHIVFAGASELVFEVNRPGPPEKPISVRLVKSQPLPNKDLAAGKIVDTMPPQQKEEQDDPEKSELLAALDSRAHAKKQSEKVLHKDMSVTRKKVEIPNKMAAVGLKKRPATAPKPVTVEFPASSQTDMLDSELPNPFVKPSSLLKPQPEDERQKVKYKKELEQLSPDPKLQTGQSALAMQTDAKPQEGERFLSGEDVDYHIANNSDIFLETRDELVISLNTREFKYLAYFTRIRQSLNTVWFYPDEAMAQGLGGQAQVRFTLAKNGTLKGAKIVSSSGEELLDRASIMTVKSAGPFPAFPASLDKKRVHIVATFSYRPVFSSLP